MAIDRTDWLSIEQNSYRCNKMAIDRSDCHTHHDISWQIMTFEDLLASSIDPQVMPPCLKYQIIIGPGLPCRSNDLVWNIVLFTENFVARKNVWTYINSNRSLLLPNYFWLPFSCQHRRCSSSHNSLRDGWIFGKLPRGGGGIVPQNWGPGGHFRFCQNQAFCKHKNLQLG